MLNTWWWVAMCCPTNFQNNHPPTTEVLRSNGLMWRDSQCKLFLMRCTQIMDKFKNKLIFVSRFCWSDCSLLTGVFNIGKRMLKEGEEMIKSLLSYLVYFVISCWNEIRCVHSCVIDRYQLFWNVLLLWIKSARGKSNKSIDSLMYVRKIRINNL